jgi:kynureninase
MERQLVLCEPDEMEGLLDERVAVLMLTEVNYRTGRLHDTREHVADRLPRGKVYGA